MVFSTGVPQAQSTTVQTSITTDSRRWQDASDSSESSDDRPGADIGMKKRLKRGWRVRKPMLTIQDLS